MDFQEYVNQAAKIVATVKTKPDFKENCKNSTMYKDLITSPGFSCRYLRTDGCVVVCMKDGREYVFYNNKPEDSDNPDEALGEYFEALHPYNAAFDDSIFVSEVKSALKSGTSIEDVMKYMQDVVSAAQHSIEQEKLAAEVKNKQIKENYRKSIDIFKAVKEVLAKYNLDAGCDIPDENNMTYKSWLIEAKFMKHRDSYWNAGVEELNKEKFKISVIRDSGGSVYIGVEKPRLRENIADDFSAISSCFMLPTRDWEMFKDIAAHYHGQFCLTKYVLRPRQDWREDRLADAAALDEMLKTIFDFGKALEKLEDEFQEYINDSQKIVDEIRHDMERLNNKLDCMRDRCRAMIQEKFLQKAKIITESMVTSVLENSTY